MTRGLIAPCRRAAAAFAVALTLGLALAPARAAEGDDAKFTLPGPWALVDAAGKTVKSTDFPGRWLLVYFGYTRCADFCPTALSTLVAGLAQLGPAAEHVQPIFITVDPEHDQGPDLAKFTAAFDPRLLGLSGTPEAIAAVARLFDVKYDKVVISDDDYVIDHSVKLTLVDPNGRDAESFSLSEPHLIAATLFAALARAGVPLDQVNNLGAYR